MSVNKIGSKLAHGVRQVKSQQIKPGQPEADKPEALPCLLYTSPSPRD